MAGLHQRAQVVVRAQRRVDVEVVERIVFVIGPGDEYGVQVQAVHAQPLKVIEVFPNAAQRAAPQPLAAAHARGPAADGAMAAGKAVREDVVHHGVDRPRRHHGAVGAVVKGQLEVLRAVVHEVVCEDVAVKQACFLSIKEFEIIVQAVEGAVQLHLPPVVPFVLLDDAHRRGEKVYGRFAAGGVAIIKRAGRQIAARGAQAKDDALFTDRVAVFGHGQVQNRVFSHWAHPFTPPAVRPEVMYFWHSRKMTSTGSDTSSDAAANTGQLPLVSVACRPYSPAASV